MIHATPPTVKVLKGLKKARMHSVQAVQKSHKKENADMMNKYYTYKLPISFLRKPVVISCIFFLSTTCCV